jgi:hypothetical protein
MSPFVGYRYDARPGSVPWPRFGATGADDDFWLNR